MQLLLLLIAFGGKNRRQPKASTKGASGIQGASTSNSIKYFDIKWIVPQNEMNIIFDFFGESTTEYVKSGFKQYIMPIIMYGYVLLSDNSEYLTKAIYSLNNHIYNTITEKHEFTQIVVVYKDIQSKYKERIGYFVDNFVKNDAKLIEFFTILNHAVISEVSTQPGFAIEILTIPYEKSSKRDVESINEVLQVSKDAYVEPDILNHFKLLLTNQFVKNQEKVKSRKDADGIAKAKGNGLNNAGIFALHIRNRLMLLLLNTKISGNLATKVFALVAHLQLELDRIRHGLDIDWLYDFTLKLFGKNLNTFKGLMHQFNFIEAYSNICNGRNIKDSIGYLVRLLRIEGITDITFYIENDKLYSDYLVQFVDYLNWGIIDNYITNMIPLRHFLATSSEVKGKTKYDLLFKDVMTFTTSSTIDFASIYDKFCSYHHIEDLLAKDIFNLRNKYIDLAINSEFINRKDYLFNRIGGIAIQHAIYESKVMG